MLLWACVHLQRWASSANSNHHNRVFRLPVLPVMTHPTNAVRCSQFNVIEFQRQQSAPAGGPRAGKNGDGMDELS